MKNGVHLPAMLMVVLMTLGGCRVIKPQQQPALPVQEQSAAKNLIIFYEATTGKEQLLKAARKYRSTILYQYDTLNGIAVTVPPKKALKQAIAYYKKVPGVLSVTEDQVAHTTQPN